MMMHKYFLFKTINNFAYKFIYIYIYIYSMCKVIYV